MEFKTLSGISTHTILEVFNAAFSDYFIPLELNKDQLKSKMLADKTNLDISVGAFENNNLIGVMLHGIDIINDETIVYNGGTGVIPSKRGHGLTKQMYHYILPILKDKGVNKLVLEVISENTQAIKSYTYSGYKTVRKLVCYKGDIKKLNTNSEIQIQQISIYNWDVMSSFWDSKPTWQNSIHVLNTLKQDTKSFGAFLDNKLIGYVIFNSSSQRIHQIAVHQNWRQQHIASTLVSELISNFGNSLAIINVDKTDVTLNSFLKHIGLHPTIEQLEMEHVITD